ncbi:MAG: hypothetical protein VX974_11210 [Pseudomonadota bacterium]|jgi:hypothetical protein|nr:hypothetical protein [Pseudomonadota bacterium]
MTEQVTSKGAIPPRLRLIAKWNMRPRRTRWISAGPLAFAMAILSMASLPHGLPAGAGGVDHLVMPVVLFPLLWAVLIVLPVLPEHPGGVQAAYAATIFVECALILAGMWG